MAPGAEPRPPASDDGDDEASARTSCSGLATAKGRRESNLGLLPRSTKTMKLRPEPPVPAWRRLRDAASRTSASCLGRWSDDASVGTSRSDLATAKRCRESNLGLLPRSTIRRNDGPARTACSGQACHVGVPNTAKAKAQEASNPKDSTVVPETMGIAHPRIDPTSILILAEAQEHR